jgi:hypothetical protein
MSIVLARAEIIAQCARPRNRIERQLRADAPPTPASPSMAVDDDVFKSAWLDACSNLGRNRAFPKRLERRKMQHRIDRLDAETWAAKKAVKGASKSAVADLDTFFDRMDNPSTSVRRQCAPAGLQPIKAALQPDTVNPDRNALAAGIWPCEPTMLTLFAPELRSQPRGGKRSPAPPLRRRSHDRNSQAIPRLPCWSAAMGTWIAATIASLSGNRPK